MISTDNTVMINNRVITIQTFIPQIYFIHKSRYQYLFSSTHRYQMRKKVDGTNNRFFCVNSQLLDPVSTQGSRNYPCYNFRDMGQDRK